MKFKRLFLLILLLPLIATSVQAEPHHVKMATLAPLNTPWMDAWYRAEEIIHERTPVPLKFTAYAGGVMGDEPDIVRKLKVGQIQVVGLTVIGLAKLIPEVLVLTLPFLFENEAEIKHIVKTFRPEFDRYAAKHNLELLSLDADGVISTFSKNKVETVEQFRQQKVWIWTSDPVSMRMADVLGIEGVLLGVPEVRVGLQTGMIDTVFGSPTILVAMQWHNQINYHYPDPVAFGVGAMVARDDYLHGIPDGQRGKVNGVVKEGLEIANRELQAKSKQVEADMLKTLLEGGMEQVHTDLNEQIINDVEDDAKKLWDELAGKYYPRELLDRIIAELERYRSAESVAPAAP